MAHDTTARHLRIVRAPAREPGLDPEIRPVHAPVLRRPTSHIPAVVGSLALSLDEEPRPERHLRLVEPLPDPPPQPSDGSRQAAHLVRILVEVLSGMRATAQLRPYATERIYAQLVGLARSVRRVRPPSMHLEWQRHIVQYEGVCESSLVLRVGKEPLLLAFRLDRSASRAGNPLAVRPATGVAARRTAGPRPWLCTAFEHQ